jgi:hypothetical protein
MKFKKGDTITRMEYCSGFEKATVLDIFEDKGRQYYKLKILNGTATMPVVAEVNYERLKK